MEGPLARARGPWVTSWSIGVASADIDGTLRSCFRRGELCAGEGGVPVVFVCCMLTGCSVECAHSVGGVASPGAAHDRCGCVSWYSVRSVFARPLLVLSCRHHVVRACMLHADGEATGARTRRCCLLGCWPCAMATLSFVALARLSLATRRRVFVSVCC